MKKNIWMFVIFIVVFLAGVATMRVWDIYRFAKEKNNTVPLRPTDSLLMLDLKGASVPEGVTELEDPDYVELSVPSQLSKISVPGMEKVISRSGQVIKIDGDEENEEKRTTVDLSEVQNIRLPSGAPQPVEGPKSAISMINAPVSAKLIKTAEEYKAFKRTARGKYPSANFATDNVLVLESTSNLPDKVFEIQDVSEEGGKMVVTYRVSVFGLDKKTNTHSAVLIQKRDLPLELKQVL